MKKMDTPSPSVMEADRRRKLEAEGRNEPQGGIFIDPDPVEVPLRTGTEIDEDPRGAPPSSKAWPSWVAPGGSSTRRSAASYECYPSPRGTASMKLPRGDVFVGVQGILSLSSRAQT